MNISYRNFTPVVTQLLDGLKWETQCMRRHNNSKLRTHFIQVNNLTTLIFIRNVFQCFSPIMWEENDRRTLLRNCLWTTSLVTWNSSEGILFMVNLVFLRNCTVCKKKKKKKKNMRKHLFEHRDQSVVSFVSLDSSEFYTRPTEVEKLNGS